MCLYTKKVAGLSGRFFSRISARIIIAGFYLEQLDNICDDYHCMIHTYIDIGALIYYLCACIYLYIIYMYVVMYYILYIYIYIYIYI